MTDKVIDGIIKDWGDRDDYGRIKPRKGRNIRSGKSTHVYEKSKRSGGLTKNKLIKAVRKVPEVMVKISGGGKSMSHIKEHIDYISRNGELDLEDENGDIHRGKADLSDIKKAWATDGLGIPEEDGNRREAFNIIFSMPPGTDRNPVKDAVRALAEVEFKDHQYVFSSHDDEEHPHVHLCVKAASQYGIRLNPRKNDLQRWRELFVEKLNDFGIEANATPRWVRGIVQKREKQAIRHINKDYYNGKRKELAKTTLKQREAAIAEVETGTKHVNPFKDKIIASRKLALKMYAGLSRELLNGEKEDKVLALEVVKFVQNMPPLNAQHDDLVTNLRAEKERENKRKVVLSKETVERKIDNGKDYRGR